jgi:glycosyltransferase involved in cell wall biosynthesis
MTLKESNVQGSRFKAKAPLAAFDVTFAERNTGGSRVYARALLSELLKRDDIAVRTVGAQQGSGLLGTIRWLAWEAHREAARLRPDVVHCPAFVAPWRLPKCLVITMHDVSGALYSEDYPLEWRLYSRFVIPRIARRARAIITGTQTSRSDLARYYGINPGRISVTPYGVDDIFRMVPDRAEVASFRDEVEGAPIVLFSGAPLKRKNLDIVLRVLQSARPGTTLSRAHLLISGATGEEFPAYREWIKRNGMEGRVRWLGQLRAERLPALYAAADVLSYPSLYEGFGFPPLEAMSVGTPVVASDASCLPDVLGDAALLVNPRDESGMAEALEAVLSNSELRRDLSERGKAHARRYTWATCAEATVRVYRSVAGGA